MPVCVNSSCLPLSFSVGWIFCSPPRESAALYFQLSCHVVSHSSPFTSFMAPIFPCSDSLFFFPPILPSLFYILHLGFSLGHPFTRLFPRPEFTTTHTVQTHQTVYLSSASFSHVLTRSTGSAAASSLPVSRMRTLSHAYAIYAEN